MSIESIPVKSGDVIRTIENLANQVTFLNTAIIAICERQGAEIDCDELLGLQNILFNLEGKMRGVTECLYVNSHLLLMQKDENHQTPKEALDAYLAQES